MILKEFIKETQKNQMISTLLKHYKVESVRWKYKSIKDHAYYNVDKGILELSNRYKRLKTSQVKDFLITMIHEIRHAMDSKKYGWKKFKEMYEMEIAKWQTKYPKDLDGWMRNKREAISYEKEAEDFGQKNWKKWYTQFKKEGLI